jgi:predicted  nucleic acid-binding Zn-ribbon protein
MKAHLEEKVANLRRERELATREVETLGLRVAIKELERQAKTLEDELGTLNGRRSALEQKLASFSAPAVQAAPTQAVPQAAPLQQKPIARPAIVQ